MGQGEDFWFLIPSLRSRYGRDDVWTQALAHGEESKTRTVGQDYPGIHAFARAMRVSRSSLRFDLVKIR